MSSLVQGDSSAARAVSLQQLSISLLIDFVETDEQSAEQMVNSHRAQHAHAAGEPQDDGHQR